MPLTEGIAGGGMAYAAFDNGPRGRARAGIGEAVRLDKVTWVLAVATVVTAVVLGWLAGAVIGVAAAAAGLVPAALWEVTR
jgi:preprotein translocase subunit SecG